MEKEFNEGTFWDKSKIDTSDIYDMEYWSTIWGVSKEQILDAVTQTRSNLVATIEQYLLKHSANSLNEIYFLNKQNNQPNL